MSRSNVEEQLQVEGAPATGAHIVNKCCGDGCRAHQFAATSEKSRGSRRRSWSRSYHSCRKYLTTSSETLPGTTAEYEKVAIARSASVAARLRGQVGHEPGVEGQDPVLAGRAELGGSGLAGQGAGQVEVADIVGVPGGHDLARPDAHGLQVGVARRRCRRMTCGSYSLISLPVASVSPRTIIGRIRSAAIGQGRVGVQQLQRRDGNDVLADARPAPARR